MDIAEGPTINDNPNIKLELEKEAEQYSHKLYVNLKNNNKVIFVGIHGGVVTVKYLNNTSIEVDYDQKYFDRTFNPVT